MEKISILDGTENNICNNVVHAIKKIVKLKERKKYSKHSYETIKYFIPNKN